MADVDATGLEGVESEFAGAEPVIGGLHGDEAHHFFCAYCMTWMFTRPAAFGHIVNVRPTMFDDHAWFAPFVESFTKTRLPWALTGAVHSFEEYPPMEALRGAHARVCRQAVVRAAAVASTIAPT